jgi:hypothetical protein
MQELQASERKLEKARDIWMNMASSKISISQSAPPIAVSTKMTSTSQISISQSAPPIVVSTSTRPSRHPSARKKIQYAEIGNHTKSNRLSLHNTKSKALKEEKIDRKIKMLLEKISKLERERALARSVNALDRIVGNLPSTKYGYTSNDAMPSVGELQYYEAQDMSSSEQLHYLDETISTLSMNDDSRASTESADDFNFIDDFTDSLRCADPAEEYIIPVSTDLEDHSYRGTPTLGRNSLYASWINALYCFLCSSSDKADVVTDTSVESEDTSEEFSTADSIKRVPIKAVTIKNQIAAIKAAEIKVTSHKLGMTPENARKQL